jgi:class 3 adenylate cyclase
MADLETQIQKLSVAIAGLQSQRKSLGNAVVDPAIAPLREQLTQLESARGDRAETDERKLVTIVFADVSGFTALSERLDPEKVRKVINACFDWLVPVVQKYDGTIDKFIGDEIMAVFGAPAAHEDDAERALRAALDMMDAIVAFNHANGTELGLHIGINTGLVVAAKLAGAVAAIIRLWAMRSIWLLDWKTHHRSVKFLLDPQPIGRRNSSLISNRSHR